MGLLALAVIMALFTFHYKRRRTAIARQDNQRARLLAVGDFSQTRLPQSGDPGREQARGGESPLTLPHRRPAFAIQTWAGGSVESLTSNLRSTPFIWPLGGGSSPSSPADRRSATNSPLERRSPGDMSRDWNTYDDNSGDVAATGSTTARADRPLLGYGMMRSSSSLLRRLRSARYGGLGSGSSFGFPFGGGGYRSLGEGESEDTTPSSGPRRPYAPGDNLGTRLGHGSVPSGGASTSEMHKSPLPPSYLTQGTQLRHASQNSHGSSASPFSSRPAVEIDLVTPMVEHSLTGRDPLARPGASPVGPRPLHGPPRPNFERADTSGSVWEVPPTYASLQGKLQDN